MMMKRLAIAAALLMHGLIFADAKVGSKAPDFTVHDATGKTHKLTDYKGKFLVLEWYNKDCPYVRKHYDSKNMQNVQANVIKEGVAWLTVVSSANGKQGHQSPDETLKNSKHEGSNAQAILLDESGAMGKAYGAKTTPHMFLIDKTGLVVYNGAIDSDSSKSQDSIAKADNYLMAAVKSALQGKKIAKPATNPYGCSVKY